MRLSVLPLLFVTLAASGTSFAQNLLNDPQIVDSSGSWHAWARKGTPELEFDRSTGHGDSTSLRITSGAKGVDGGWIQGINVIEDADYDYSFWFKTKEPGGTISLLIELGSADGKYMGQYRREINAKDGEWTNVTGTFHTTANGTASFGVWKNLDDSGEGTAWFDDFQVTQSLKPKIYFDIEQPADRILRPAESVVCSLQQKNRYSTTPIDYESELRAGTTVLARQTGHLSKNSQFSLKVPKGTPDSKLNLRTVLKTEGRETIFECSDIIVKRSKPAKGSVGKHHEMLVNGKPFFPLGLYYVNKEELADAAKGGFNCAQVWASSVDKTRPYLKEAERLGIHVVTELSDIPRGQASYDELQKRVEWLKKEPSLLSYYIVDEPNVSSKANPALVRRAYNDLKVMDPEHPVFYVDCLPQQLREYEQGVDILAVDPYQQPEGVRDWVTTAVQASDSRKPVWAVLGAFPIPYISGYPDAPSAEYIRCCVYTSLISGAKGILYFSYRYEQFNLRKSRLWQPLVQLNKEINAMLPYLFASTPEPLTTSDKNVIAARFKAAKGSLVLVANMSPDKPAQASIDLPGVRGGVYGFFDSSKIECPGKLNLSLRPYETIAIKIKPH